MRIIPLALVLVSLPAAAAEVSYDATLAALDADGFAPGTDVTDDVGGVSMGPGGELDQFAPDGTWWSFVRHERGWVFEVSLSFEGPVAFGDGPSFTVDDGTNAVTIGIADDGFGFTAPVQSEIPFDTAGAHTYAVDSDGTTVTLAVDGVVKLRRHDVFTSPSLGSVVLASGGVTSLWTHVHSDTFALGRGALDDDNDGIPNDEDLCPAVADDGTDSDGDHLGDACDLTPNVSDFTSNGVCQPGTCGCDPTNPCDRFLGPEPCGASGAAAPVAVFALLLLLRRRRLR